MHQSTLFFFRCLCHCLLKTRLWGLWDFTVFSTVCGAPVGVGTSMGFCDFFPVGGRLCVWRLWDFTGFFAVCGAAVSGAFKILRFFTCVCGPCVWGLWDFTFFYLCVGPLCVKTLRGYGFFPYVWGPCVYGDFEILRFFLVCVGPVLETLKVF